MLGLIMDQPLSQGSGEFLMWEFPLAYWMEKEGYDVSYISNVDTAARTRTSSCARRSWRKAWRGSGSARRTASRRSRGTAIGTSSSTTPRRAPAR